MANRLLHDTITTSKTIQALSWQSEVLFYRLLATADDHGRFNADPAVVMGRCFPLKSDLLPQQVGQWLDELEAATLLKRYLAGENSYAAFTHWWRYQTRRRINASKYPAPPWNDAPPWAEAGNGRGRGGTEAGNGRGTSGDEHTDVSDGMCRDMTRSAPSCVLLPVSKSPVSSADAARTDDRASRFEQWYARYPRRIDPDRSRASYMKHVQSGEEDSVDSGLEAWIRNWYRTGHVRLKPDGQYIAVPASDGIVSVPHPSTWLNNRRWEAELPPESIPRQAREVPTPEPPGDRVDPETVRATIARLTRKVAVGPGSVG